jgi:hypothetical protein
MFPPPFQGGNEGMSVPEVETSGCIPLPFQGKEPYFEI